ncbi:MAG: futalosine hydrolase [Bacteroidia bacterium]
MQILLVAATFTELMPLIGRIHAQGEAGQRLKSVQFQKHQVDVLMTGVGAVATTYHLTRQLLTKKYDAVFNLGICGSFDSAFALGKVLHITTDCFADMGAEDGESFLSAFDLNLVGANEVPFARKLLLNENFPASPALQALPRVTGITVNTVSGKQTTIDVLKKRHQPQTESMEGAAFFYTCMLEKIPCAQIRAVSNYVEPRNRDAWQMGLAIKNLNEYALLLLENIQS